MHYSNCYRVWCLWVYTPHV